MLHVPSILQVLRMLHVLVRLNMLFIDKIYMYSACSMQAKLSVNICTQSRSQQAHTHTRLATTTQCVAVCYSVLQCVAVCCSVLQCVAVCCNVLQCVAVCCSVLQCAAVCCMTHSNDTVSLGIGTYARKTYRHIHIQAHTHTGTYTYRHIHIQAHTHTGTYTRKTYNNDTIHVYE